MSGHVWEKSYPPGVSWDPPRPPPVAIETILGKAAENWPARDPSPEPRRDRPPG